MRGRLVRTSSGKGSGGRAGGGLGAGQRDPAVQRAAGDERGGASHHGRIR